MSATDIAAVIADAIERRVGCCVLYVHGGEASARVLWPSSCRRSRDGHLSTFAFDSLRGEWRSFRIDRIVGAHLLTGPFGRGPPGGWTDVSWTSIVFATQKGNGRDNGTGQSENGPLHQGSR